MKISLIVATDKGGVIGSNNQLLWRLSADLSRFKSLTTGHHIIMGRKTYESIGKPLPNRTNIIVTRNKSYKANDCIIVNTIEEALTIAKTNQEEEVFIIGGADIYNQVIKIADFIYLTLVATNLKGDAFFPVDDVLCSWKAIRIEKFTQDDKNEYDFEFIDLVKN